METTMILKGIAFAALGIGLFVLATYAVMRLWNWLVPSLFNGPKLRFVQALGLFFLARLLFGFGGGFGRGHYGGPSHGYWRQGGLSHGLHQPYDRDDSGQKPLRRVVPEAQ